jgi:hypothetical protein
MAPFQNFQLHFPAAPQHYYAPQPVCPHQYDQSYAWAQWARNQAANVTTTYQGYSGTPLRTYYTPTCTVNQGIVPSITPHPPSGQSSTATTPYIQAAPLRPVPTGNQSANNSKVPSSEVYVAISIQEGLHILLWQGKSVLVQGLMSNALRNNQLACLTAVISKGIVQGLQAAGLPQAGVFQELLRTEVVDMFKTHWKWVRRPISLSNSKFIRSMVPKDGDWRIESELLVNQPQHKGTNMASYLGALFAVGILSGDDVHACLDILRHHAVHFDRLRAMHAIIIEAGDKMCFGHANKIKTKYLRDMLAERCPVSGQFVWGPDIYGSIAVDVGRSEKSDESDYSTEAFRIC